MATGGATGVGFLGGLLKGLVQGDITRNELTLKKKNYEINQGWLDRALMEEPYKLALLEQQQKAAEYQNQVLQALDPQTRAVVETYQSLTGQNTPYLLSNTGTQGLDTYSTFLRDVLGLPVGEANLPQIPSLQERQKQLEEAKRQLDIQKENIKHKNKLGEIGYEYQQKMALEKYKKNKNKSPFSYIQTTVKSVVDRILKKKNNIFAEDTGTPTELYSRVVGMAEDLANNPDYDAATRKKFYKKLMKVLTKKNPSEEEIYSVLDEFYRPNEKPQEPQINKWDKFIGVKLGL